MSLKLLAMPVIIILVLVLMISPASSVINVTVQNRTQSYITWQWASGLSIANASIDGYTIYLFDPESTTFTLSDLPPDEEHTFRIYSTTDSGLNTSRTLPDTTVYHQMGDFAMMWGYVILIAIMFILGAKVHWLFFWFGSGISLYALVGEINDNLPKTGIESLAFWIYIAMFIMGFILWLTRKRKY